MWCSSDSTNNLSMVILLPGGKKKATLIQWSVQGCSSFNAGPPLRTRNSQYPESFSHSIYKCLYPLLHIMVCFSTLKLFCVMQAFMSLFILKLPTPLKASYVYYVGDITVFQTSNLSGSCFFLGQTIEPQPEFSTIVSTGKMLNISMSSGKGELYKQHHQEMYQIEWERRISYLAGQSYCVINESYK